MYDNEKLRYSSPDSEHIINLGHYDIKRYIPDRIPELRRYDLYAINAQKDSVSFGARYGDNDDEYRSGEAHKINGKWVIYAGGPLAIAAARYFANIHKEGKS